MYRHRTLFSVNYVLLAVNPIEFKLVTCCWFVCISIRTWISKKNSTDMLQASLIKMSRYLRHWVVTFTGNFHSFIQLLFEPLIPNIMMPTYSSITTTTIGRS